MEDKDQDYDIGAVDIEGEEKDNFSLDQIFSKEPVKKAVPETVPETVPEPEKAEEPEPEKEPEQEQKQEPKEQPEDVNGLKYAITAERQRRQEAEDRLKQLLEQQKKPAEKKEFDWENPNNSLESVKKEFQVELEKAKLDMSSAACAARHEDYQQKEQTFISLVAENPALYNTMMQQRDPAEWAYNYAKRHETMQRIGNDPSAYENELRARIEAEIVEKYGLSKTKEVEKRLQETAAKLPPSAARMPGKKNLSDDIIIHENPLKAAGFDR
jgi:hypothetical protein